MIIDKIEIWELDRIRLNNLKETGYDVEVVWETDFKKSKELVFAKLEKIINEKENPNDF